MFHIKGECYYYYSTSLFTLFISSFTDAAYTSLFAIVYTIVYSTQSLNIALFSCLLRTLAVWYRVTAPCNLAVRFCTLSSTCLVTIFVTFVKNSHTCVTLWFLHLDNFPAVMLMNEWMNEWKFWLSPGFIKNESLINQRTHNITLTMSN